jgi:hypothetical protein
VCVEFTGQKKLQGSSKTLQKPSAARVFGGIPIAVKGSESTSHTYLSGEFTPAKTRGLEVKSGIEHHLQSQHSQRVCCAQKLDGSSMV